MSAPPENSLLIEQAIRGDQRCLEELLKEHYNLIFNVTRRITGSDDDAYDATQEALISISRGIKNFDRRSKFSTWVYRIATNAALDELRKRKRRPIPNVVSEHSAFADVLESRNTNSVCFEDSAADRQVLKDALAQLAPDFAAPVILRDIFGLDYNEIADSLELPDGTVRSRIARGRAKLAQLLNEGNQQGVSNVGKKQR